MGQLVLRRQHVHSTITGEVVRLPLTIPMWLDCQSHTGLRMNTAIFGHMLEGNRKAFRLVVTSLALLTQEPLHLHLWDRTFTVNLPLAMSLKHFSGSPIKLSGMERTVTLEAIAVTMLSLHGSGGHSRRRLQRT